MPYSQVSFQQLLDTFALRLADPAHKFWISAEKQSYLIEAMRTWQAMAAYLSVNVPVPLTPNTVLYDLVALVPQIAPSVTDRQIIPDIQQALQEPTSPTSWVGTEQYNYAQMVSALQRRLDRFILETGIRLSISEFAVAGNPVPLDNSIIDVRRAMWRTALANGGTYSVMWKADPIQLAAAKPTWSTDATTALNPPTDYTVGLQLPLTMEITPTPTVPGFINLITVNSGPTLDPANVETILGVPDDLCWIIKWGVLADMLASDGIGEDMSRAQYCESRWNDGIKLARIVNVVRHAFINGNPAFVDSLTELDQAVPSWVSALAGSPQFLAVSNNILATSPIVDNSNPTLTMDVTPKFPIPALGDFIQLGKESLDVIIDYAEHLAHFKEGAVEVAASQQLYKNMLELAAVQNDRLREVFRTFDVMSDRTNLDKHTNPRRESDLAQAEIGASTE